jgi:hypothetical protein
MWSDHRHLTEAFTRAWEQAQALIPGVMFDTYQGLMNALLRWSSRLIPRLCQVLHQRMRSLSRHYELGGWVPLAMDGFRIDAPRTQSNEAAFCAKNYGQGKRARYGKYGKYHTCKGMRRKRNLENPAHPPKPQVWCTILWHMVLRLPWLWRTGPSNASERHHAQEMIQVGKQPKNTLFCADAGFVGFPFWSQVLTAGCHFLVRVGSNVNLLSEVARWKYEKVGNEIFVLCWPLQARTKKQMPLRLRLMRVCVGKTEMNLLTSVLDDARLPLSLAQKLYAMRWGVEVEIRGLKQTMDRVKLRCRDSRRLMVELDWSILAMAVVELFAIKEQLAAREQHSLRKRNRAKKLPPPDPARRSLAMSLRALQRCLRQHDVVPAPGKDLATLLMQAVTDDYVRASNKRARYCPKNPDKKPLGNPVIKPLGKEDRQFLQQLGPRFAA